MHNDVRFPLSLYACAFFMHRNPSRLRHYANETIFAK